MPTPGPREVLCPLSRIASFVPDLRGGSPPRFGMLCCRDPNTTPHMARTPGLVPVTAAWPGGHGGRSVVDLVPGTGGAEHALVPTDRIHRARDPADRTAVAGAEALDFQLDGHVVHVDALVPGGGIAPVRGTPP